MPIRKRNGKWEYRFWVNGGEYSKVLDLDATERNRTAAAREEAEAYKLVTEGKASMLRLQVVRFSKAADAFLAWARGEYRDHPNTATRLSVSMSNRKVFFGNRPVSSIGEGDLEDYKSWRRTCPKCGAKEPGIKSCEVCAGTGLGVQEITLRHDLYALSPFFEYAIKHNWARENPVRKVEIPSDADAVRIHVLSRAEEELYFAACQNKERSFLQRNRKREAASYRDLYDVGRLMLLQGCRPEELRALDQQADVDLEASKLRIRDGKSKAAKRTLRLVAESREILTRRLQKAGRWVFPSPKNPGKSIGSHQRAHEAVLKETGLSFVLYDLRHSFATRAAERGMPLATLAAILGHSNLRSVMKYVHISQENMDREMMRLERSAPALDDVTVEAARHRVQ
jgi:integrase